MDLVVLRDVVIVIFGVLGIVTLALLIFVLIVIFRKVVPILDSAKTIVANIRGTSSFIADTLVKPAARLVSFAAVARKVVEFILKPRKEREDKKRGK